MKRFKLCRMVSLVMIMSIMLILGGCGSTDNSAEATTEEEKTDYEKILSTLKPDFDNEKALLMDNANYEGMVYIDGRTFYGRFGVKSKNHYQFVKMELVDDPDNSNYLTSGDWSILSEDIVPKFINKVGDTLYYVAEDWTGESDDAVYSIEKVSTDGSGRTKLADGNGYLTVKNDKLYFTDLDNRFVSTDLDGKNKEVIIDKKVFYTYFITDNWILYQDDPDNESLHVYSISDDMDFKLNDEPSYNPVVFENAVYFTTHSSENEEAYNISRIDLTSYSIDGDNITFTQEKSDELMGASFKVLWNEASGSEIIQGMNNANGHSIDLWKNCEDDAYDTLTETYLYLSKDIEVYVEYNDEGAEAKMFTNNATGYSQSISSLD